MESFTHKQTELEQFETLSEREQVVFRLSAMGYSSRR